MTMCTCNLAPQPCKGCQDRWADERPDLVTEPKTCCQKDAPDAALVEREAVAAFIDSIADNWVRPTALNYPVELKKLAFVIRQGVKR
jgi:hypothetical protein